MTVSEFENFLIRAKAELLEAFNDSNDVKDLDVYIKAVLDYQELIAKKHFQELHAMQTQMRNHTREILKTLESSLKK